MHTTTICCPYQGPITTRQLGRYWEWSPGDNHNASNRHVQAIRQIRTEKSSLPTPQKWYLEVSLRDEWVSSFSLLCPPLPKIRGLNGELILSCHKRQTSNEGARSSIIHLSAKCRSNRKTESHPYSCLKRSEQKRKHPWLHCRDQRVHREKQDQRVHREKQEY